MGLLGSAEDKFSLHVSLTAEVAGGLSKIATGEFPALFKLTSYSRSSIMEIGYFFENITGVSLK